jgi:tRNA-modifying protein YgfZ
MSPIPPDRTVAAPAPAWGLVTFEGADAAAFLHGQLATDVAGMAPGAAGWSSYNSPKGRMLASLLLWRRAPDAFGAFVAADLAETLAKRLSMFVLRAKVKVADRTGAGRRFGVAGAAAEAAVRAALGEAPAPGHGLAVGDTWLVAAPDGRLLVHAPDAAAEDVLRRLLAHAQAVSPAYLEWRAIGTGVAQVTRATQDLFVPQMANFDLLGGVDFHKGCYPGQEIVARMQYLGRLKERLRAFHVAGDDVPAPATPLYHASFGEQACGTVVNAAPAPEGGSDLLAVVQWSALAAGDLHLGTPDGPVLAPRTLPYDIPAPTTPDRPKL